MNYYKLEKIQNALRIDYRAERLSVGPKPRVEIWGRVVDGETHKVAIAWEHGEEILSEDELIGVADALRIPTDKLIENVKARGGLWLDPIPPGRK